MTFKELDEKYGSETASTRKALELFDQEKLCVRCNNRDESEMLCEGLMTIAEQGEESPRYSYTPCAKYIAKAQEESVIRRLENSGVPEQYWSNKQTYNNCLYLGPIDPEEVTLNQLLVHVAWYCNEVGKARFIHFPMFIDKYKDWRSFMSDYAEGFDFLVIHRYDMGIPPEFICEYFLEALNVRRANNLGTLITCDLDMKPRNDVDEKVIKLLKTWHN